jgi:hypothetical protein
VSKPISIDCRVGRKARGKLKRGVLTQERIAAAKQSWKQMLEIQRRVSGKAV